MTWSQYDRIKRKMGGYKARGMQFHAAGQFAKRNAMFSKFDALALLLYRESLR